MKIRNPSFFEMNEILEKLNYEFINSKGKSLHIKYRYPGLYEENNLDNIFLLEEEGKLASFIAAKTTSFISRGKEYRVFFIGSVFTENYFRGRGFGSQLMRFVQQVYEKQNFHAGVLWTNLHEFYSKLGWIISENGIYVNTKTEYLISDCFEETPSGAKIYKTDEYHEVDKFRISQEDMYLLRITLNRINGYGTVYSPGEEKLCYVYDLENELKGYLLGVKKGETLIIYEMSGQHEIIYSLLKKILIDGSFKFIKINLPDLDNSTIMLKKFFSKFDIEKPQISMYLPIDSEFYTSFKKFYIPFTDRI